MSYRRSTHRVSYRVILALTICGMLVIPLAPLIPSKASISAPLQARMGQPQPGKPEVELPDLEDVKRRPVRVRHSRPPIPSVIRSKKNAEQPWDGRRVGDPFPLMGKTVESANQSRVAKANHARATRVRAVAPPPVADDAFVQNFFYWALGRYAGGSELTYWNDQFRVAYTQGSESVRLAAIELGKTLFESAEYAARGRDAHWYVYDLYKTYLMRDPDSGGWTGWENLVPSIGRVSVRRGFEDSGEFANLMATITPNGSASGNQSSLITAQVDSANQPDNGMFARDAAWNLALLNLPGRAGLDLGLALSYSSMVWTQSGPYIYFDEDTGSPSPGFRLGFPTLQRRVFDAQTARNAYLLITTAGRRIELRQIGTSNIYEAGDSSYLQLTDNGATKLLRSTDGMQLTFSEFNNEYRCIQTKDRNGNYLTVNYNGSGHITTITDTLGRVITFNYDVNANLISITQLWNGQSHQWVSFGWTTRTMQSSFSGVGVVGTWNGESIPVISQVSINDGSYFQFEYTNSLQVSVIRRYSFDTVQRAVLTFNYETPAADTPRLSDSRVSATNWTGINGVPAEVITQYRVDPDGARVLTAPDGTVYKDYYGSGWQKGLSTLSEVWSGGVRQKWTTTSWTQDNTGVNYKTNPRVSETNIYDPAGNRRRVSINYGSYAAYGLPYQVIEYAADGETPLRSRFTDYNLSAEYVNRRIIGLISQIHDVDHIASSWVSKTTFEYDWGGEFIAGPEVGTVQHDDAYYGTGFVTGRGNVSASWRWDVDDITNSSKAIAQKRTAYNTSGTVHFSRDALGHQTTFSYQDSFSDNVNRNTFAYATSSTDADGNISYVQYSYDLGGTTRTQGAAPAGQSQGMIQTMLYNSVGQLERVTTVNNGAYKRFWYGPDYTASLSAVNNVADEAYSIQTFDGIRRPLASASNHPGSSGGYKAQLTVYDQMGRVIKTSNPAEITAGWAPTGDDAAGWLYTQQTYDWKGRPLLTTNPDGTTREASYSGCGCAGGELVTLTDEGTIDGGVAKRRQQRTYSDVLGRAVKTEVLNWQGGSVYSTTTNTYNARDQITTVKEFQGAETSGIFQQTVITYDGYGRQKTKHVPEQSVGTATSWNYNADDTIQSVTDARGATSTFSYNNRHLVTGVVYSGGSGTTPNTSFGYDAAGNRTSMSDGFGSVTYGYDQLSRLTSETRYISELNRSYNLSYGYNLANQVTSIGMPFNSQQVTYSYNTAGRVSGVGGSGFSDTSYQGFWPNWYPVTTQVPTFVSNILHRASGSIKQMTFGNGGQLNLSYNARLAPNTYQLTNMAAQQTFSATYTYYNDGRIRSATDMWSNIFDRFYSYDQSSRYKEALTGDEARGGSNPDGPYRQTYGYDVWGNTTSETRRLWTGNTTTTNSTYTNNRRSVWSYDANGFATAHEDGTTWYNHQYDAAGRRTYFEPVIDYIGGLPAVELRYGFDGNSLPTKTTDTRRTQDWETGQISTTTTTTYQLHSTVLGGQVIADLDAQGNKTAAHIYLNGMLAATEFLSVFPSPHWMIYWQHMDPVTGSKFVSNIQAGFWMSAEFDPLGADVSSPPPEPDLFVEPPYVNPKAEQFWPLEIPWDAGRTNEMEIGMAQYLDTMDMVMAREAWRRGDRDRAQQILAANPNVGIIATGPGAAELARRVGGQVDASGALTIWGMQAARGLGFVYTPQELQPSVSIGAIGGDMLGGGGGEGNGGGNGNAQGTTKLSNCLVELLAPFFPGLDLKRVNVHATGIPKVVKWFNTVQGGAGAVTWGWDIYYPENGYSPNSNAAIAGLAHELVHVWQYSVLGKTRFAKEYAQGYVNNVVSQLPKGTRWPFSGYLYDTLATQTAEFLNWLKQAAPSVDLNKAYEEIPLEKEAYTFQQDFKRYLDEVTASTGKSSPCP